MSTAIEKSWPAVPPQALTADGTNLGVINVADSRGFKVKQQVVISATGQPDIIAKIMRFTSPTQFRVGPVNPKAGQGLTGTVDLSLYTVASGAFVYAQEQPKVTIKPEDIIQAVYRQEPGTTIGVEIDDQWGRPIDTVVGTDGKNRLAVDTTITVESIEIGTVDQGAPNTPANAWPVEVFGPNGHAIEPNADGSINVDLSKSIGLFNLPYDAISVAYPSAAVENYQSYLGGLSGSVVQLVVVTYSDSTKNNITSVVRTPTG